MRPDVEFHFCQLEVLSLLGRPPSSAVFPEHASPDRHVGVAFGRLVPSASPQPEK
jgi:hypothetical protein